jgi:hypothetical protein
MRRPHSGNGSLIAALARSRYLAAIEGTVIGLLLGLIDVHSQSGDWFEATFAYLVASFVLGLSHGGRSWQAWAPLGWSFYLMHRGAIACGYRPPYVEADANTALHSLYVLAPAGLGLVLGMIVRYVFTELRQAARPTRGETGQDPANTRNVETPQPVATSSPPRPRRRLTVAQMMVAVAWIGIHLATLRALLILDPFFGFSTFYAEQYSESRFRTIRVGMTPGEVEAIIGRPLGKDPLDSSSGSPQEMWYYSDRPDKTANYWRRWVVFENGKVVMVINDFWFD